MSEFSNQAPKHGKPLRVSGNVPAGKAGRDAYLTFVAVRRLSWIAFVGLVLGAAIGAWAYLFSGAQYKASAQILLQGAVEQTQVLGQDVVALRSDPVLASVAGQLKLYQDAWFSRPYWWQRVLPARMVAADGVYGAQARVLSRLNGLLDIERQVTQGLWRVSVTYRSPEMAALIANNVVDAYRAYKLAENLDQTNRYGQWLGARLEALRGDVVASRLELITLLDGRKPEDLSDDLRAQLSALEQDMLVAQRLYEQSVLRYQDMIGREQANVAIVRVVAHAPIPGAADPFAYIGLVMWLGLAGFGAGLGFVLLKVLWAQGFASSDALEIVTGYPVFASVPLAKGAKAGNVQQAVNDDPAAVLAESLRSLRIALRLRGENGRKPRTVVFTSTLPNEGKTSLAVMLATIAAKAGERVCVVDCDLRNPSLHRVFGIGNARGITEYLSSDMGVDDVIYRRDPSGIHLVTAKAVPTYSLSLLTYGRMERMVAALREQYDLVIFDAPSSLAFADARVLSHMVDQTLFVVEWNGTSRRAVKAALKHYADIGYDPLALVLNKVDMGAYLRDTEASAVYAYNSLNQDDV